MVGLVQVAPQAAVVVVEVGGDEAQAARLQVKQLRPLDKRAQQTRQNPGRGDRVGKLLLVRHVKSASAPPCSQDAGNAQGKHDLGCQATSRHVADTAHLANHTGSNQPGWQQDNPRKHACGVALSARELPAQPGEAYGAAKKKRRGPFPVKGSKRQRVP
ncbi:hypothetical protein D9M69_424500 [compost metagenome]